MEGFIWAVRIAFGGVLAILLATILVRFLAGSPIPWRRIGIVILASIAIILAVSVIIGALQAGTIAR